MGDNTMADSEMEKDSDPIRASYDVYIKPHISADRQIYVLQFPNRDSKQQYSAAYDSMPLKMRTKPNVNMVELDVPMDVWRNYDAEKGLKWGEAMKRSNMAKGGGSHGLPGGFGIGGAQPTGRGRGRGNDTEDQITQQDLLKDYAGAIEKEQVLVKQTLGGQAVANDETTPQYMIGTFRKDQLHLTPVDCIVQMRPQFHHIDAFTEQERFGRARDPLIAARMQEARAIHMTVKSNVDGEEETTDTMAERISAAQAEAWKNHRYVDEDSAEAWESYNENLFVGTQAGIEGNVELLEKMPKLVSVLDDGEYLDLISGPRHSERLLKSKGKQKSKNDGEKEPTDVGAGAESDTSSTLSDIVSDSDIEEVAATQ